MKVDTTTLLLLGGAAVAIYFLSQQAATPTPLSIYPSMAHTPIQKASTIVPASSLFSSTQTQAQNALLFQCVGSFPGCTPLLSDWQLGL
jgi:hypothetical protein